MSRHFRSQDEYEKEFVGIVDKLSYTRQKWEVWSDLMAVMACALSNAADRRPGHYDKREQEYLDRIKHFSDPNLAAQAMAIIVEAMEQNPDQDFLGSLYMRLELGSHWHGQFFTPYSLCRLMAEVIMDDPKEEIDRRGWISICDPCIGGGAMMVAAVTRFRNAGVNYHDHVMFVGQDVDRVAGMMAYIQLSLLGCPGYIVVANTLTNPLVGDVLIPAEKEGQEFWYTPFYFKDTWEFRRRFRVMDRLFGGTPKRTKDEPALIAAKERHVFFFDFTGGNYDAGRIKAGCS